MQCLADEYRIHVRTLRKAAQDGRLRATFSTRMVFGKLIALATREAVETFKRRYYRQTTHWNRPAQPTTCTIPDDWRARHIESQVAADAERPRRPNWCGEQGGRVSMGIKASTAFTGVMETRTGNPVDGLSRKLEVWSRPVAVLELRKGSLLISDDGGRKIWRVSHGTNRSTEH